MTINWDKDGFRGDKMKSNDNDLSETKMALQEIKLKIMTINYVKLRWRYRR